MNELHILLNSYIQNSEDPEINFMLARWYHSAGQTASAVSFYLRCAERSDSLDLQYECLLHASNCFLSQEKRNLTVRGLLQHAISLCPHYPEAYWMLSRIYQADASYKDHWINCYTFACLGLHNYSSEATLRYSVQFPGKFALVFQKALSAWWCGLCNESYELFKILKNEPTISSEYLELVNRNIAFIDTKGLNN